MDGGDTVQLRRAREDHVLLQERKLRHAQPLLHWLRHPTHAHQLSGKREPLSKPDSSCPYKEHFPLP